MTDEAPYQREHHRFEVRHQYVGYLLGNEALIGGTFYFDPTYVGPGGLSGREGALAAARAFVSGKRAGRNRRYVILEFHETVQEVRE